MWLAAGLGPGRTDVPLASSDGLDVSHTVPSPIFSWSKRSHWATNSRKPKFHVRHLTPPPCLQSLFNS